MLRSVRPAARHSVLVVVAAVAAGCGGGDEQPAATATEPGASAAPAPTTNAAPPARSAQGRRGRGLVARSGCFACHTIGGSGNDGPGPELTDVGYRMPASAIARVLVDPTPPMPSFASLPREDRAAIVAYLSSLR